MANAARLSVGSKATILEVGYPGAGKTGSLACLVDAGLKLRILAFDKSANMQPLFQFVKDKDKLSNVDIVFLEDKLRNGAKFVEPVGIPTAFADGLKLMDRWKYTYQGEEVDLGMSKDWGPDTVVVLDSLTAMGECAKRRAMVMLNKTPLNMTQQCWGLAMADQMAFLDKLTSSANRFHLVVLAHLKSVGPQDIQASDSDVTKSIKEQLAEVIPTRLYPSALGKENARQVASLFSCVLLVEPEYGPGSKVRRVLRSIPRPELDLKLPANVPDKLDITDGLLTVLTALTGGPEQWFASAKGEANE